MCGSLYPSGSRWLSLQSLSEIGAPTLASLRKGFRGPSMRLHLTNLVVSAASSAPPRSAPAPTSAAPPVSGGSQPASRCPRSRARSPGRAPPASPGSACVPLRWGVGWAGPAGGGGPVGSVSPVVLPAWTFALRRGVGRGAAEGGG